MTWSKDLPEGNESKKIKWEVVEYTSGRGLDIGCGRSKLFDHFIGVDSKHHAQFGWTIRPDVKSTAEKLDVFASASMDFVFSSHLLEHIDDTSKALREWWRVLKPGGYLILYLPHKDFYPNMGSPDANQDHKHDFIPQDIVSIMTGVGSWDLARNEERNEDDEYSFLQVYQKNIVWPNYIDQDTSKKYSYSYRQPKPEKTCAVIRYGAFGDLIQASSILPGLKDQGYHVTLYTSNPGYQAIREDPHLDKVVLQDKDQVPNTELAEFWAHLRKKYDKFVNLSESVEGVWLALPGRSNHEWPQALRHKFLNTNYLEFTHELAGVPLPPQQAFYATKEEKAWAYQQRQRMGRRVVLWSLAGSSVHKTWPYLDNVIAKIMLDTDWDVVLVGGPECAMLEAGWENEKRVYRRCGIWEIRQTLAFIEQADVVVGPETGVLNAAGLLSVPKVVTLSHSSAENLTKHWANCTALTPRNTSCYPCHQLHYSFDHCRRDQETGVAACQADIPATDMYEAIEQWLVPAQSHTA